MIELLIGYAAVYFSVFFHELMHVFFAVGFKLPLVKVQIGADWLQMRVGKCLISPLIGTSFVEAKYEAMLTITNRQRTIYFLSGAFGNILLGGGFLAMGIVTNRFLLWFLSGINVLMAIISLLPWGRSDISVLRSINRALSKEAIDNKRSSKK